MTFKGTHTTGILAILGAAVLWSTSGVFIKYIDWHPMAIASIRSMFALLLLLPLSSRSNWRFSRNQIGVGIFYAGMMLCFVSATKYTTAANAILLQYTSPIYAILLSTYFLGEKIRLRDYMTLVLLISGMSLFFFDELGDGSLFGNFLGIFSGVCLALLTLFMRRLKEGRVEGVILGNIFVILGGLPFIGAPWPEFEGWASLVFLGIFQIGLAFFLFSWCVPYVSTAEQILIPMIEPILNPLWVFIFIGEKPDFYAMIGGVIVILSVTGRCLWDVYRPIRK